MPRWPLPQKDLKGNFCAGGTGNKLRAAIALRDFFLYIAGMKNLLAIDIGAGTMDILCYVPEEKMHYKAVVQSPVRTQARVVESARGNLVVDGVEMGGPESTRAEPRSGDQRGGGGHPAS